MGKKEKHSKKKRDVQERSRTSEERAARREERAKQQQKMAEGLAEKLAERRQRIIQQNRVGSAPLRYRARSQEQILKDLEKRVMASPADSIPAASFQEPPSITEAAINVAAITKKGISFKTPDGQTTYLNQGVIRLFVHSFELVKQSAFSAFREGSLSENDRRTIFSTAIYIKRGHFIQAGKMIDNFLLLHPEIKGTAVANGLDSRLFRERALDIDNFSTWRNAFTIVNQRLTADDPLNKALPSLKGHFFFGKEYMANGKTTDFFTHAAVKRQQLERRAPTSTLFTPDMILEGMLRDYYKDQSTEQSAPTASPSPATPPPLARAASVAPALSGPSLLEVAISNGSPTAKGAITLFFSAFKQLYRATANNKDAKAPLLAISRAFKEGDFTNAGELAKQHMINQAIHLDGFAPADFVRKANDIALADVYGKLFAEAEQDGTDANILLSQNEDEGAAKSLAVLRSAFENGISYEIDGQQTDFFTHVATARRQLIAGAGKYTNRDTATPLEILSRMQEQAIGDVLDQELDHVSRSRSMDSGRGGRC